jgi:DNA processing protein
VTLDQSIALSLLEDLPRTGLTERLLADDPELLERASWAVPRLPPLLASAAAAGIRAVPWNAPGFPQVLLTLTDCPPALWCRGTLECLDAPAVAIVGSRAATAVALEAASRIAAGLAALGVTVISGLARGVDSAAHRGALGVRSVRLQPDLGSTVAVLGSGVDRIYPAEHKALADAIVACGAVISEYPPGTAPLPFHFPMRNRLISGLSSAIVVIEAAEDSGSLITAACALEQGRDVMVVPGNVLTGRNRGGHALIRDGAAIVECAADVAAALGIAVPGIATAATHSGSETSDDPLLARMTPGEPCDLDALAAASGLDAARLIPRLVDLELRGLIRRAAGGRFVRS